MLNGKENAPRDLGGRRGASERGRDLYTDTHCNTEGYPGAYEAFVMPKAKPASMTGWKATALLAASSTVFAWCACYLVGCLA